MNNIGKLAAFLAIIAGLSGLCLSVVNNATAPIIQQQALEKELSALADIFPNASFEKEEITDKEYVTAVYTCDDGVVYNCATNGFGGTITFMLAVDNDGKYIGFVATDVSTETKGFGSRVGDQEFADSVTTFDVNTQIDTLSGATVSSTAVQKAVNEAAEMYKSR